MTHRIVCVVEGDGEVRALPILLRRLAEAKGIYDIEVPPPIRVRRDQFLQRPEEFRRKLLLAAGKAQGGAVFVVLDADDDCPVEIAHQIHEGGRAFVHGATLHTVVADREYEAWLIAAAESLAGRRNLRDDLRSPDRPEDIRNAKGWLSENMVDGRYHEVIDQPALTAIFDVAGACQRSRSFRKFVETFERVIDREGVD